MPNLSTAAARNDFSNVLNRAAFGKERVILERRGKAIAAIVPIEDVKLLREIEDRLDIQAAMAAKTEVKKKGTISLKALRKKLQL